MRKVRDVVKELNSLGSREAVADRLYAAGIKAKPSNYSRCAIAQYIRQESGVPVGVTGYIAETLDDAHSWDLSTNVQEFVEAFDSRVYPDLIEEPRNA